MRVIKPVTLRQYGERHRDAREALRVWFVTAESARWKSIADVRVTYPHADAAKVGSGATVTIFNIKGNAYRLITAIHYSTGIVFIRDFLTHAEYSKGAWKDRH